MAMTFPPDFATAVDVDGLLAKHFPTKTNDGEFRTNLLQGFGCQVMQTLQLRLKGRHSRKGAGCILQGDYAALWELEMKHIADAATAAKTLMARAIEDQLASVARLRTQ